MDKRTGKLGEVMEKSGSEDKTPQISKETTQNSSHKALI